MCQTKQEITKPMHQHYVPAATVEQRANNRTRTAQVPKRCTGVSRHSHPSQGFSCRQPPAAQHTASKLHSGHSWLGSRLCCLRCGVQERRAAPAEVNCNLNTGHIGGKEALRGHPLPLNQQWLRNVCSNVLKIIRQKPTNQHASEQRWRLFICKAQGPGWLEAPRIIIKPKIIINPSVFPGNAKADHNPPIPLKVLQQLRPKLPLLAPLWLLLLLAALQVPRRRLRH